MPDRTPRPDLHDLDLHGVDLHGIDLHGVVATHEHAFLELLAALVAIDSGSYDHDGVRRISDVCEAVLRADGLDVERRPAGPVDVLVARRRGTGPTILLNAHMDTVFEPGAAAARPFRIEAGRALGPGVADDKCGIAAAVTAMRILEEIGSTADLLLVLTPDEEIGSPGSREVLRELAAEADVGLCLEAARADGSLVSARKGGADVQVMVTGRAAHSGVEPEKGIHAALQMAHTIIGLQALNDPAAGTTVNVGVARSGTRPNIVPDEASLQVDLRAWTGAAFAATLEAVRTVATSVHVPGVVIDAEVGFAATPMEATPQNIALADLAVEVAAGLGITVGHVATGGIGDANAVAGAGIPVLDGLAPVGGDDHTTTEWLAIDSVVPRLALLVGLIERLATGGVPVAGTAGTP